MLLIDFIILAILILLLHSPVALADLTDSLNCLVQKDVIQSTVSLAVPYGAIQSITFFFFHQSPESKYYFLILLKRLKKCKITMFFTNMAVEIFGHQPGTITVL